MSEHQPDSGRRVVITASEVASASVGASELRAPGKGPVPWWAILLLSLLAICLPLLCLVAIGLRVALRGRPLESSAWTSVLCTLLTVSSLFTSTAAIYLFLLKTPLHSVVVPPSQLTLGLVSHDLTEDFPSLPSATPMTPVEIADRANLLVFIVTPATDKLFRGADLDNASIGAAALLMADDSGYLAATNRHVADASTPFGNSRADRVLLISHRGSYAYAEVIGRHKSLDLALLWVERRVGHAAFRQPIATSRDIAVGSSVFVIGHPQRLFFTLSSGLISRAEGNDVLQLSAPISPGNSGGPAYDSAGNLLGLITYAVDKQTSPNAENLNFATRADAFLTINGWEFQGQGKDKLERFIQEGPRRAR